MIATSYVVYLLIPTYTHRPVLTGDGFTLDLMRLIYGNDRSYNALPSGHTYNTALIAVIWSQWQPAWRWLWILITVIVMMSTLFTRQHNVLDVLFGLIWGIGAYLAALRSTEWCKRLA
jgi:membrane-associated phospholipid phosphatase